MSSIETKAASAILSVIRARKGAAKEGPQAGEFSSVAPAKLREASFSDFDGVMDLRNRWGLPVDSLENWDRLWRRNPALEQMRSEPPIGWVLEAEGRIVGYLGNIALLYSYGDRTLTAVTGSGLVTEPAYRVTSVSLVAAFYRQTPVDLYLTTTAIPAVGKISRAFRSVPLPQAEYESVLFWVLQPRPFAEVVMKKLALRPYLSRVGGMFASLAVRTDRFLRRRWPSGGKTTFTLKDIGVDEIGEDFQIFWRQKVAERPRLLADRRPATLRWHFGIHGDRGSGRVLCCHKNGELLGYAVVRHEPPSNVSGLRRSIIADMLAKEDDPAVLRSLWVAAYDQAKQAGSHVFEVLGFPPSIRQLCSRWRPYVRKYPACPFYYKAADPSLHDALSNAEVWYATPFDGDTTLFGFGRAT